MRRTANNRRYLPASLGCLTLFAAVAVFRPAMASDADETTRPVAASLSVEPAEISLRGATRRQQVLVTAIAASGRPFDATRDCTLIVRDAAVARIADGVVVGVAAGETELIAKLGELETSAPVQVAEFDQYPPVHFGNDVIPILSKLGCNSGACHGKASGQNGFKLSVFGFDPAADYDAIVKEARGRRLFPASPTASLFLLKPTAQAPHGGGRRIEIESPDYELILEWIKQGMPIGGDAVPQLVALRVSPTDRVMGFQAAQQILATAVYSDGDTRDVTSAASYTSNSDAIAEVNSRGLIQTGRVPGEAAITVHYMGQVGVAAVRVPRPDAPESYPDLPVHNPIDRFVWAKLRVMGVLPSEPVDDATFLRRLYLDAIGTLPTPDEARAFLADPSADKRDRAIDGVLDRDEYAQYWALKWADILLVDRNKLGERGAFEFHRWLHDQFAGNRPYDQWAREIVTATGNTAKNGPANFFRALRTTEDVTKSVSQAFLGVRLECAQCHHHPFERWAQADFYGLAGFFSGIERKPIRPDQPPTTLDTGSPELIYHAGLRETRIPYFDTLVTTQPLGGWNGAPGAPDLTGVDPRAPLADWMTDPRNPYFARLAANRLCKHYLGRGLVEPEDDLRSTNPPTNPPLLGYLAAYLVEHRYDLKALMRLILQSRVYQTSSVPNATNRDDAQNYSHYTVKRLPAEVLIDAISQVTGVPERFAGQPPGTRAIALWDNRLPSYFLEIFGRPERNTPCECGRSSEPTMSQALHLMNAPEVAAKISDPNGRVARLLKSGIPDNAIVQELCLAALCRQPTQKEIAVAEDFLAKEPRRQAAEDFLWTLLNSYDFVFVK